MRKIVHPGEVVRPRSGIAKIEIGDELVFNVQGRPIETVVSSIREVDFRRVQTNFFVVFPREIKTLFLV